MVYIATTPKKVEVLENKDGTVRLKVTHGDDSGDKSTELTLIIPGVKNGEIRVSENTLHFTNAEGAPFRLTLDACVSTFL